MGRVFRYLTIVVHQAMMQISYWKANYKSFGDGQNLKSSLSKSDEAL